MIEVVRVQAFFNLVCVQSPKPVILSSGLQSVVQNFMPGILPVQKHSVRTKVLLKKPLDIGMWKLQRLFQDLEHQQHTIPSSSLALPADIFQSTPAGPTHP
jgi:hypothetical protein